MTGRTSSWFAPPLPHAHADDLFNAAVVRLCSPAGLPDPFWPVGRTVEELVLILDLVGTFEFAISGGMPAYGIASTFLGCSCSPCGVCCR